MTEEIESKVRDVVALYPDREGIGEFRSYLIDGNSECLTVVRKVLAEEDFAMKEVIRFVMGRLQKPRAVQCELVDRRLFLLFLLHPSLWAEDWFKLRPVPRKTAPRAYVDFLLENVEPEFRSLVLRKFFVSYYEEDVAKPRPATLMRRVLLEVVTREELLEAIEVARPNDAARLARFLSYIHGARPEDFDALFEAARQVDLWDRASPHVVVNIFLQIGRPETIALARELATCPEQSNTSFGICQRLLKEFEENGQG